MQGLHSLGASLQQGDDVCGGGGLTLPSRQHLNALQVFVIFPVL